MWQLIKKGSDYMLKKIKKKHLIVLTLLSAIAFYLTSLLGYCYVDSYNLSTNITNTMQAVLSSHMFVVPITQTALGLFAKTEIAILLIYICCITDLLNKLFGTKQATHKINGRDYKKDIKIFIIGILISSYCGILYASAWTPGADFNKWMADFQDFVFVQHHFIVGFTEKTLPTVLVCIFFFLIGYMFYITKLQHPFKGEEYGNAKWQDAKEFSKKYANHDESGIVTVNVGENKEIAPFKVNTKNYWIAEDVYINIENKRTANLNMLVIGPPGSGKSFRLARPVLSQLCGSFLVTDPKGELSSQTAQFFLDNGFEAFVLNVESEEAMINSIHFNPFRYISNESDIMSIANILMKATSEGEQKKDFFEQSAEVLLTAILYYMHYQVPEEEQNWKTFVKLLNSTTVKSEQGEITNEEGGILDLFEKANKEWQDKYGEDEYFPGYIDIEKYYNGAPETTSSIVASLDTHCKYMKLKCVQELLSEDEIDIVDSFGYCKKTDKCPTGKRILYICTSEDKRYYDWIVSMVYSLFFDCLYHLTAVDKSLHETLPEHLTFLMDEFANVTLPNSFVEKLSTMRSRNMSAIVIVQNLVQLKRKFPENDMDKDLIGNMSIIDVLGAPDWDSCEYLSKHFGTMTIQKQSTSGPSSLMSKGSGSATEDVLQKPLLSPEDIFKMDKDGPCAIVVKGTDPIYQTKVQFQNSPFLKLLTRKEHPYIFVRNDLTDEEKEVFQQEIKEMQGIISFDADDSESLEKFEEDCKNSGVKIIELSENDIDAISVAQRHKLVEEETEREEILDLLIKTGDAYRREEEIKKINFDDYSGKEYIVVGKLVNIGFKPEQIHALDCLIHSGQTVEQITEYFNPGMAADYIASFADRIAGEKIE